MSNTLRRTEFGNPILRTPTHELTAQEVLSSEIQKLIADMQEFLKGKKTGIGLAATQVNSSARLCVIAIKPTPNRPHLEPYNQVMINPAIINTFGRKAQLWEACISGPGMYAKVPRYKRIEATFLDENGRKHTKQFEGIQAHVVQHEVDHLNGILFVDRVKDTSTYTTQAEFKKLVKAGKA